MRLGVVLPALLQAEKAARAEKAAEKKKLGGAPGAAAASKQSAASPNASVAASTPNAGTSASSTPRSKPMKSPALTPSLGSSGAGSHAPPLSLGERRDSVIPGRERSGSGGSSASAAAASGKPKPKESGSDDPKKSAAHAKKSLVPLTLVQKSVPLFSHLPQYERATSLSLKLKVGFSSEEIHPAILSHLQSAALAR